MHDKDILFIHGTDYRDMTLRLLEAADLAAEIGARDTRIALKPNILHADRPENGALTHPEILAGAIEYLQNHGFTNLRVMEGAWVGAKTMPACRQSGIYAVCESYGIPFIDLQADESETVDAGGMKLQICREALCAEFLINLPVLKGHCQTRITCALKNMKGCLPNSEKRRFHSMGLHKPIGHLAAGLKQDFVIVDNICGDLDFEEGGTPVPMQRIFCAKDPVLCDAYVCETLGIPVEEVPYIATAAALGAGCADVKKANLVFLNEDRPLGRPYAPRGRVGELAAHVDARDACSACYGSLIHALDKLNIRRGRSRGREKICIGQGYRGKSGGPVGVGACTKGCAKSLPGCPPTAAAMRAFLEENWS